MSQQKNVWKVETDGTAMSNEIHIALGVSHRQAKGLIDARCVTINGELAKSYGQRLRKDDEIVVDFDTETTYREMPHPTKGSDSEVNVLWEDKHLVFLDKPAGILSVPTEHSDDTSLADALAEHYRQQGIKKPRIYIAHRLDKYTTGVMVFAKTPEALNGLKDLFQEHYINRIYRAILVGELPENSGTLHDRLVERTHKLKMAVVAKRTGQAKPQGSKPAVTHYRVIERLPGHTVVELKLETGRRNQIRVQFAERGYPLLGDRIYGSSSPLLTRQALHAELLGLRHPVTDETITIKSELPPDIEMALQKLRVRRRVNRAKEGIKGEEGIFKPRITKERIQGRVLRAKRFIEEKSEKREDSPRAYRQGSNKEKPQERTRRDKNSRPTGKYNDYKDKPRQTRFRPEESEHREDSSKTYRRSSENEKPKERTRKDNRGGFSLTSRPEAKKHRTEKSDYKDKPRQMRFRTEKSGQRNDSSETFRRSSENEKPKERTRKDDRGGFSSTPRPEVKKHRTERSDYTDKPRQTRFRSEERGQNDDSSGARGRTPDGVRSEKYDRGSANATKRSGLERVSNASRHVKRSSSTTRPFDKKTSGESRRPASGNTKPSRNYKQSAQGKSRTRKKED